MYLLNELVEAFRLLLPPYVIHLPHWEERDGHICNVQIKTDLKI
jgi:hypothetical protein